MKHEIDVKVAQTVLTEVLREVVQRGQLVQWTSRIANNMALAGSDSELLQMTVNQAMALAAIHKIIIRKEARAVLSRILLGAVRAALAVASV